MAFSSKPLSPKNGINGILKRHPLIFGASFIAIIVGASFGMQTFTELGIEKGDNKVTVVTKDEEVRRKLNNARRFDIREEYFRHVSKYPDDAWENVRIPRPGNLAEWGEAKPDSRKPVREITRK